MDYPCVIYVREMVYTYSTYVATRRVQSRETHQCWKRQLGEEEVDTTLVDRWRKGADCPPAHRYTSHTYITTDKNVLNGTFET